MDGILLEVVEDPKSVASCIVRWSGVIGLPELVDALPPIPNNGILCPCCKGARLEPEGSSWAYHDPEDDGFRYECSICMGLGWTKLDETKANAES